MLPAIKLSYNVFCLLFMIQLFWYPILEMKKEQNIYESEI